MIRLRELSRKDLPVINSWRLDRSLNEVMGSPYRFIDMEVEEKWFDNYLNDRNSCIRCTICDDETIVGIISLTNIDYHNRCCRLHIMIGNVSNRNKGIGTYAIREMVKHAFLNVNMNRVELGILDYNEHSSYVFEKIGFHLEGIKREAVFKNGKYVDMKEYSILKSEYSKNIDSFK